MKHITPSRKPYHTPKLCTMQTKTSVHGKPINQLTIQGLIGLQIEDFDII